MMMMMMMTMMMMTVFNLEIMESGSDVPCDILN